MKIDNKLSSVLIFCFLWSVLITFNKFVLNMGINPLLYYMYSQGIASIILFFYSFGLKKQKAKISKRVAIIFIILGFILSFAYIATTFGLKMSTSINYGFIVKAGVIFGPLLAFFFLDEKLSRTKILLIPAFILGAYLISTNGERIIPQKGDLLILLSAFLFSITDVMQKKLTNHLAHDIIAALRGIITTVFLIIIAAIFVRNLYPVVSPIYLIISGFIAAISQLFLFKTISLSSVSYLSMMTMLTPVIVSVIGFFILKEPFILMHFIGGTIIIISGILVNKSKL